VCIDEAEAQIFSKPDSNASRRRTGAQNTSTKSIATTTASSGAVSAKGSNAATYQNSEEGI
jgi:hypothetical protein